MRIKIFQSTLLAGVFCLISVTGHADKGNFFLRMDQDIFDAIYDEPPRSEPLATTMEVCTYLGDSRLIMGVSLLLMAYGDDEHRETGRLLTSAFIGTGITVWGLKEVIGRKRPLDDAVGNPAFPSGHTVYAFAGATLLGSRYPKPCATLHRGGVGRAHAGLSGQALCFRCCCGRSARHRNRGTNLASSYYVVGVAVLIADFEPFSDGILPMMNTIFKVKLAGKVSQKH